MTVTVEVTLTEPPVTTPELEPIVAIEVLLLVHVPPLSVSDNGVVNPAQTVLVPKIADASALTVTVVVI